MLIMLGLKKEDQSEKERKGIKGEGKTKGGKDGSEGGKNNNGTIGGEIVKKGKQDQEKQHKHTEIPL